MSSDEDFGRRLPAFLTEEPVARSSVDIGRAIRTVRRRRQIRYGACAVVIAVVLAAVPVALRRERAAPPAAPPTCTAEVVESLLNASMDRHGRFFGGRTTDWSPALWHEGKLQRIALPQGRVGWVVAVNESGAAVGVSFTAVELGEIGKHSFVHANGVTSLLNGGEGVQVIAISDDGAIIGDGPGAGPPLLWRTPTSIPERLPLPPGASYGEALSFMDDGWIFGTVKVPEGLVLYRWPLAGVGAGREGAFIRLASPQPQGIVSGTGRWIHGRSDQGGAMLVDVDTGQTRVFPDLITAEIHPITRDGRAVGILNNGLLPVMTDGTTTEYLPVPAAYTGAVFKLMGVSEDGRVIAGSVYRELLPFEPTPPVLILWSCTP